MDALPLDPIWVDAATKAAETFNYGDIISHQWLLDHLGLTIPNFGSASQFKKLGFDLLTRVDGFRRAMLEDHQMMIVNVRGEGYRIVHPTCQTAEAMRRFQRDVRRSVGKAINELSNINTEMLELDGFRENAEAKAKVAWFAQQGQKRLTAG